MRVWVCVQVNIPEDPTVKEFEQQRAIMAGLDIASTPRAGAVGALGSSSNLQVQERRPGPPEGVGGWMDGWVVRVWSGGVYVSLVSGGMYAINM